MNKQQNTESTKNDAISYIRPALIIGSMIGLMGFAGLAHAGLIDIATPTVAWLDLSGLFADGASTGFDAAGAMF